MEICYRLPYRGISHSRDARSQTSSMSLIAVSPLGQQYKCCNVPADFQQPSF